MNLPADQNQQAPAPRKTDSGQQWLVAALLLSLAIGTVLVFSPAIFNDFVNYDDPDYVTANDHVKAGLTRDNVRWAFTTGHASNWHPLTWISHMMDVEFFGMNPKGHHLTSIFFHAANTLLLFLVLKSMTGALWRSAFVAALFTLHPVHVESVAWVSERKDVLSTFFLLLTLLAYGHYARTAARSMPSRFLSYAAALFLFALGLMSKPMLVTTPFLLLLLDFWPLNRIELKTQSSKLKTCLWLLLEKLPFFVLAVGSSMVTYIVQREGGAVTSLAALPLATRIENAVVSYARYLAKAFWPESLSILYPYPVAKGWPTAMLVGAILLLISVSLATLLLSRPKKYLLVGWLWFLGTLVPVIGLVQVGIQSMADRYTYIPLIGIFVAVVWLIADTTPLWRWRLQFGAAAAVAIISALAFLTVRQIGHWQNSETLFRHAIAVTKNNYLAYNNLGFHLANNGRQKEAIEYYRKAVHIDPSYQDAQNNLGHALAEQERYTEAIPHYLAALRQNPRHVEVNNNLGNALVSLDQVDKGIEHYRIALTNNAKHADAHNNLGIALAMKGNLPEAIQEFNAALKLKTNNASAHSNLGNAYAAQRRFEDAIREYEASLRISPKDSQAHNNLGNVLVELGRIEEAIPHYRTALRLKAENPEAHANLAVALARIGKRDEAIEHFREALRLKPDYDQARRYLEALEKTPAR